jgi:hypothetical protein
MTLVRCHGCHNMVSRESARCPVCGCSYKAATIRWITKWAIVAILAVYFLDKFVIHKLSAPWRHAQHVLVYPERSGEAVESKDLA